MSLINLNINWDQFGWMNERCALTDPLICDLQNQLWNTINGLETIPPDVLLDKISKQGLGVVASNEYKKLICCYQLKDFDRNWMPDILLLAENSPPSLIYLWISENKKQEINIFLKQGKQLSNTEEIGLIFDIEDELVENKSGLGRIVFKKNGQKSMAPVSIRMLEDSRNKMSLTFETKGLKNSKKGILEEREILTVAFLGNKKLVSDGMPSFFELKKSDSGKTQKEQSGNLIKGYESSDICKIIFMDKGRESNAYGPAVFEKMDGDWYTKWVKDGSVELGKEVMKKREEYLKLLQVSQNNQVAQVDAQVEINKKRKPYQL